MEPLLQEKAVLIYLLFHGYIIARPHFCMEIYCTDMLLNGQVLIRTRYSTDIILSRQIIAKRNYYMKSLIRGYSIAFTKYETCRQKFENEGRLRQQLRNLPHKKL